MQTPHRNTVVLGLVLLPAVVYTLSVLALAVDIPRWDDYKVFFDYLNKTAPDRLDFLFVPHAEHRIVFTRLVAEAMFQLLGRIDFRLLVAVGNLGLLLLFGVLGWLFARTGAPMRLFVPVPFALFLLPLGENTTWATGSIQNHYVLLFALLSLVCFARPGGVGFALSLLFAVLAALTSASGIFVFLALALWSLLDLLAARWQRRELLRCLGVLAVASLVVGAYFSGYARPPEHPSAREALTHPLGSLAYLLVFLGSYLPLMAPALLAGGASVLLFAHLTRRRYHRTNPVAYHSMVFLLATAVAATLARAGFGADYALSSRYTIVSTLLLILLYTAVLETGLWRASSPGWRVAALGIVSLACALGLLVKGPPLVAKRAELRQGMARWRASGEGLDYPQQKRANQLLRGALEKGYYRPPAS